MKKNGKSMRSEEFTESDGYLRCKLDGINYEVEVASIEAVKQGIRATLRILSETGAIIHTDSIGFWSDQRRKQFAKSCAANHQWEKIPGHLTMIHEKLKQWIKKQSEEAPSERKLHEMTPQEKEEALELLRAPDILDRIKADITSLGHVGEDINKLFCYLVGTSRKLGLSTRSKAKPLILVVQGESSVGKSYLLTNVVRLMPPEEVVELSSISEKALVYLPRDFLRNKLLTIAEMVGGEDANYYVRTLISEGKIKHAVTMKNEDSGKLEAEIVELLGPVAMALTTTSIEINPENRTRVFEIRPDESPEQTRRIQEQQKWERTWEGRAAQAAIERAIRRHQNAHRLLQPLDVIIPFAEKLKFTSTRHSLRLRRDFPKFLDLLSTVALLRQHQKIIKFNGDGEAYIEADIDDYEGVYELATEVFKQSFDDVPPKSRELLKIIKENKPTQGSFSRKDVCKWSEGRESTVRKHIRPLEDSGYLTILSGGSGGFPIEYEGDIDMTPSATIGLLSPQELAEQLRESEVPTAEKPIVEEGEES